MTKLAQVLPEDLLIEAAGPLCESYGFTLVSPPSAQQRGSHVGLGHEQAYAMVQALRELDVVADFRTPDVIRFGLTPLYLSHADVVEAAERLGQVCAKRLWDKPAYAVRAKVT